MDRRGRRRHRRCRRVRPRQALPRLRLRDHRLRGNLHAARTAPVPRLRAPLRPGRRLARHAVVGQAVVGYLLVRRVVAPLPAAVVSVVGALALVAFNLLDLPAWSLALLAATGALLLASGEAHGVLWRAGALAGLAFLFRLDVGGYVLLSLLVGTRKVRPALAFTAVVLPFAAWLLATVPLQDLSATDVWHLGQALPPVLLLLGVWLFPAGRPVSKTTAALVVPLALPLLALMVHDGAWKGPFAAYDRQIEAAARLVRGATAAGEPIFVGEAHHRFTFTDPLIVYYLADRPAGVRDTLFLPGLTNTARVQRRMVADLERSQTRYLVLDERFADVFEPSNDSRIPGATVLDRYVTANFEVLDDLGDVRVLRRHGS